MPDIAYPTPTGALPGYLAVPDGTGPWPGVVVIHDAFGFSPDLKRITDRFAAAGYLTLAPALFRHRRPRIRCVVSTLQALHNGDGPAVEDIIAARDHLATDPRCTGKIGSAGFCMGGGFCLLLAPRGVFDAAAPNYGVLPNADGVDFTKSCPVVASFGAEDRMMESGAAAKLEQALAAGGVPHDVKEYPDVAHSFMNQWGAPLRFVEGIAGLAYSEPEAEDAWRRILAFFGEHLR